MSVNTAMILISMTKAKNVMTKATPHILGQILLLFRLLNRRCVKAVCAMPMINGININMILVNTLKSSNKPKLSYDIVTKVYSSIKINVLIMVGIQKPCRLVSPW